MFKDILIFDYVNSSILVGICISSQNIANDKNGVISSCDICSSYPYVMIKNYQLEIINLLNILIGIDI